jgi:hypothetical protein
MMQIGYLMQVITKTKTILSSPSTPFWFFCTQSELDITRSIKYHNILSGNSYSLGIPRGIDLGFLGIDLWLDRLALSQSQYFLSQSGHPRQYPWLDPGVCMTGTMTELDSITVVQNMRAIV